MARYGAVVICMAAAACGGDGGTAPDPPPDIAGAWQITVTVSNAALVMTCEASGPATITQSGATFTGEVKGSTGHCDLPSDTTVTTVDGQISDGQITGNTMTYANSGCRYSGAISGSPASTIAGDVSCTVMQGDQTYPFNGTWTAARSGN
ncbi:MAG TPA: hypothetical protein VFW89_04945 [Gemmatimonadaceae bacterium]|nr:hypothetical protein [Gemmatimonadaceae bacterium]